MTNVEEKIEPTRSLLLSGNVIVAIWIALGTISCLLVSPLTGGIFLGFSVISILIILRRQLCGSGCYYCKSCSKGFAKMAMLFKGAGHIPGMGKGSLLGMAIFSYVVLAIIPGALLANSMAGNFSIIKLLVLACLIALSAYSVIMRIKNRHN